jgi:hypothetical protein
MYQQGKVVEVLRASSDPLHHGREHITATVVTGNIKHMDRHGLGVDPEPHLLLSIEYETDSWYPLADIRFGGLNGRD